MNERTIADAVTKTTEAGKQIGYAVHDQIEQATETLGHAIAPIAEHPLTQTAAQLPGLNYFLNWVGQVDSSTVKADVARLQLKFPSEAPDAIAQRIIAETSVKAGQIGLLTNIVPPIALALFAVDLAAVTKLQADMLYRIAAVYGFDLEAPTRRGELVTIYGLSLGSGTPLKTALSIVEIIPVVGAAVGASSNAALIYGVGIAAQQFYKVKRDKRLSSQVAEIVVESDLAS